MASPDPRLAPDTLIAIFTERVTWEEAMLDKIREAHGRNDVELVMSLVGELLHSGPGTKEAK
jgi:hypothetical protein